MWWCFYVTAGVSSYGGILMYMFKFLLSHSLDNHTKVGFPASEHTVKCIHTTHKHTNVHLQFTYIMYECHNSGTAEHSTIYTTRSRQEWSIMQKNCQFMLVLGRRRLFAQTCFEHAKCEGNFQRIFKQQCCHSIDTDSVAKLLIYKLTVLT